MFVISWGVWLPLAMMPGPARGGEPSRWVPWLHVIGAYGPCFAALLVTGVGEGVEGLRRLFSRLLIWRVHAGWYAAALLLPAALSLLVTAIHMMFGGDAPDFGSPPIEGMAMPAWLRPYQGWGILAPVFFLQLMTGSSLGEELGWRGFALLRLQQRFSALDASLIIAVVWAVWAQPFFHLQHAPAGSGVTMRDVLFFVMLLVGVVPAQILITWLFNSTGGSLLLVLLYNNSLKVTDMFLAAPNAGQFIPAAAYWLVTLLLVSAVGTRRLTLRPAPEAPGAAPGVQA